jgi:hypothetical protein
LPDMASAYPRLLAHGKRLEGTAFSAIEIA